MVYDTEHKMADGQEGMCETCCNPCKLCCSPQENGASCLENWARVYVQFVTAIMLAGSIAIIAFGIYIIAGIGESLDDLELRSPALASLIFGAFMFTFAFIGFAAATWENFAMKVTFSIGCGFLTFGILMAGIYITKYSDFLENVGDLTLTNQLEETILAYELAVFHECCDPDNSPPLPCDETQELPCFEDIDVYNTFLSYVGDRTCGVFGNVFYEGAALVGIEAADCGEQDMRTFVSYLSDYLDGYIGLIGSIDLALGIIFLLLTISSVFLFYEDDQGQKKSNKLDPNDMESLFEDDDESEPDNMG